MEHEIAPVVYCKDCQNYSQAQGLEHGKIQRYCKKFGGLVRKFDYCSHAESKKPKPTCAACANFLGGGDWGLCCKVSYDLCYQDSPACENFKSAVAQQVKEAP